MPNKSFNKLTDAEFSEVNDFIIYLKDSFPDVDTDKTALMKMVYLTKNAIDKISYDGIEYKLPDEIALEKICDFDFLKKIVDAKTQTSKWFCLRSKKPLLLSDGIDETSIRKLCSSCKSRDLFQLQKSLGERAIEQIKAFGDSIITVDVYACKHPDMDYIQVSLGKREFHCKKFDVMKDIEKHCINTNCNYLISDDKEIFIKETKAYKQLQKELEDKR